MQVVLDFTESVCRIVVSLARADSDLKRILPILDCTFEAAESLLLSRK